MEKFIALLAACVTSSTVAMAQMPIAPVPPRAPELPHNGESYYSPGVHPRGLTVGAPVRFRYGAICARTYGARYRWKVNGWGWDTIVRNNDDEVIEDMREGNIVRNTSEAYIHVISSIQGGYVMTTDRWWLTIDDLILQP